MKTRTHLKTIVVVLALFLARGAIAADAAAGAGIFNDFCQSCHGPAQQNFNNILLGANNPTAIQIQMQAPGSAMAYLQDILTSDDIANVAAYLGTVAGITPATIPIIEYHHAVFDHYFMTGIPAEISNLDTGRTPGWVRTGKQFNGYASPASNTAPVCRFFSTAFGLKSSHFYTPFASECTTVKAKSEWTFEGEVFNVVLPLGNGTCPAGTTPVYRLYNDGQGGAPNHRYTTDLNIRSQMIAKGWTPEGLGPLSVIMCAP